MRSKAPAPALTQPTWANAYFPLEARSLDVTGRKPIWVGEPAGWKSNVPPSPSGTGSDSIEVHVTVLWLALVRNPFGRAATSGGVGFTAGFVSPTARRTNKSPLPSVGLPP